MRYRFWKCFGGKMYQMLAEAALLFRHLCTRFGVVFSPVERPNVADVPQLRPQSLWWHSAPYYAPENHRWLRRSSLKLIHTATPDKIRLPRLPVDRRRRDAGQAGIAGSYASTRSDVVRHENVNTLWTAAYD